jgi:dolichyl-phosphate-mannose-protein mannosyltransferase
MGSNKANRIWLDTPALLLALLLLCTFGQGYPTAALVGLPLPWKAQFFVVISLGAVLLIWRLLSHLLFKESINLTPLAQSPRAVVVLFTLLILLVKWPYLQLPYFWDAMGYVISGVEETFREDFPLVMAQISGNDAGHPPLFYLMLALVWKVFSPSLAVSHLFNLTWGLLTIIGVYHLGRRHYTPIAGFCAALLLFFSPLFYAQVGMLHFEPAMAALTVWAVYFALARNLWGYLVAACALVLIKEPGVVLIPAVAISVLLAELHIKNTKKAIISALPYCIPMVVLGAWLLLHYYITFKRSGQGWFITPSSVPKEMRLYAPQLYAPFMCIFKEQYRWLPSLAAGAFILRWWSRHDNHPSEAKRWFRQEGVGLPLIALLTFAGYWLPTATVFFSPRYLLPVLPLFFILATAAMLAYMRTRAALAMVAAILLFTSAWQSPPERDYDIGGYLRYTSLLRTHKAAIEYMATEHPEARILTNYPLDKEMRMPVFGFTSTPLTTVRPDNLYQHDNWDYWVFTEESEYNSIDFPGHHQTQERYMLAQRFVDYTTTSRAFEPEVRIYASPAITERSFIDLEILADGSLVRLCESGLVLRSNRRLPGAPTLDAKAVDIEFTADGTGAYILQQDGQVRVWGSAVHYGSLTAAKAHDLEIWPGGQGYVIMDSKGKCTGFGDAPASWGEPLEGEFAAWDFALTPQGGMLILYGSGKITAHNAPTIDTSEFRFDSDVMRTFSLYPEGGGWYIMDIYGGMQTPGVSGSIRKPPYYDPDGNARDIEFGEDGRGYLLDSGGEIHPF